MIESIFLILDDCLITVYNSKKNLYPCGIWDYKFVWPLWNILKNYSWNYRKLQEKDKSLPNLKITVLSNNDCVKKGITKDVSFWTKIFFISRCLEDYLSLPSYGVDYEYSMEANWKDRLNEKLIGINSVVKEKSLFIGVNKDDYDHSKALGIDKYITSNDLINLSEDERDKLFLQGGSPSSQEGGEYRRNSNSN